VLELQADLLSGGDLVHGDFNSCNILIDDGAVSGVIDVAGFRAGTRVYDYACLLREAYVEDYGDDVIALIHDAARDIAGAGVLAACAASAGEFILEFKQRHEPWRLPEVRTRLERMTSDLARPR
jgi:aminoglycoside phosphotransferase (APT) family kinase protein